MTCSKRFHKTQGSITRVNLGNVEECCKVLEQQFSKHLPDHRCGPGCSDWHPWTSSQQPTATVPQLHCLNRGVHYIQSVPSVKTCPFNEDCESSHCVLFVILERAAQEAKLVQYGLLYRLVCPLEPVLAGWLGKRITRESGRLLVLSVTVGTNRASVMAAFMTRTGRTTSIVTSVRLRVATAAIVGA